MIRDAAVRRDFRWIYTALGGRGERERQTQCSTFQTHKWRMNEEEKGDVHRVPQESVRWRRYRNRKRIRTGTSGSESR
jgi:hypothetical protein